MANTSLVEAQHLRKNYGSTEAVRNVSFEVKRGEVVGFLGPNGAGKTTTMKMLTGYLKPTSGQAFIGGISVSDHPLKARKILGYLPENAPLYDDMMVVDFLRYIAELRDVSKDILSKRLQHVSERCGLMDVLGKDIGQLSKGYRQRVGLAQALVHDPDLLILDEPTSGLDPNQIVEIRALIRDLGRDKTVLLSTHILPEVQATCSRIMIISNGQLVADDTPDALSKKQTGTVIKLLVKSSLDNAERLRQVFSKLPGIRTAESIDGENRDTVGIYLRTASEVDPREAIFTAAVQNQLILLDMHREHVSLEETFRLLTKKEGEQHVA